jgi:aspartate carbamoyltransferase catalytic subunit
MGLAQKDIVSIREIPKEDIVTILDEALRFVPIAKGDESSDVLKGKILAALFIEPSTRTRLSFESAMMRLGGQVLDLSGVEGSSLVKGESLADTIRMAECYSDIVVLRHPQEGAARMASLFCKKPVINAGDGAGQHPTQTLLDLFTIRQEFGRIEGLEVVLVGDLKYGRTVHSLAFALALFGASVSFAAPPELQMPKEVIDHLESVGVEPRITSDIRDVISDSDVLYVTRIQKERFPSEAEYVRVADSYRINMELLCEGKEELKVMHPLPRIMEIDPLVDETPHAIYFRQAFNGVPVRMALLKLLMEASK